jgi:hypothetical protein
MEVDAEKARKELDELCVPYDHVCDAASIAVMTVRLELILLHDQLCALSSYVCATYGLAATNL